MNNAAALDPVASLVRRHDPDRFFTALFAPPAKRAALLTLYAFNHELARAREVASAPPLALIRLHWWREVVQGVPRRHEVATPLAAAIADGALDAADLLAMVDAREVETEDAVATLADWQGYVLGTAGTLAVAAGRALRADAATLGRLRHLGAAYGAAGQLRSVAALARQGRCLLPLDRLSAHDLSAAAAIARPDDARLAPVLAELAEWGRQQLRGSAGKLPRDILPAALPAVLARRDLRRPPQPPLPRGIGDKAAVLAAFLAGGV
jgi:15-cis-phytoene synthase